MGTDGIVPPTSPAMADNGVRVMVPPHIGVGTRVVVNTGGRDLWSRASLRTGVVHGR